MFSFLDDPSGERGFKPGGRRQRWTFEMAIKALARRMEALGIPIPPPPEISNGDPSV